MNTRSIRRSMPGLMLVIGLAACPSAPCQAGSLAWLDDVVQQVMREASVGTRAAARTEGQASRMAGKLFLREGEESLATVAARSESVARLATRLDEPTEAALRLKFAKLVGQDADMVRAFSQLAPQERRLVLNMSEAAQTIARRYPGQADVMVRKLGVEGLSAVRAYGDDVAEVLVKEGPDAVGVLRKAGRTGWTFFTEQVLPHKGKLAAAGVLALFLANPEQFVDTAGKATQYAAEQFATAGVQLAGYAAKGAARGFDQAAGSLLGAADHPLLRAMAAILAAGALLVLIGFPMRFLLKPLRFLFAWPRRLIHTVRAFMLRVPAVSEHEQPIVTLTHNPYRKQGVQVALAAGLVVAGVAGYDAWGYQSTLKAEQAGQAAAAQANEERWNALIAWHPTLPFLFPNQAREARKHRDLWQVRATAQRILAASTDPTRVSQLQRLKLQTPELATEIAQLEQAEQEVAWRTLHVADAVAVDDPVSHLARLRQFLRDFPETPHRESAVKLAGALETRINKLEAQDDRAAIDRLNRAMSLPSVSWRDVIADAQQSLDDRPDSPYRLEFEELLSTAKSRLDESDIERARQFSRANPTNTTARRDKYTDYLRAHAQEGSFVAEARQAIQALDRERDLVLYRQAYEHHVAHSDDVPAIAGLLRGYLEASPQGEFAAAARQYIQWWEKISTESSYQITLKRGKVEPKAGKWFGGAGPDVSVTITVAGVEYGPSPVIRDTRTPIWEYTFPKPVRWKYGDPVTITIRDHDWTDSTLFTFTTSPGDKLAMRLLSGTVRPLKGGKTELLFRSDFQEPTLPRPE